MIKTHPPRKLKATVRKVLRAAGDDFVSTEASRLPITFEGIEGDFHAGISRRSGSREPWYERDTVMRNERQVSILSREELDEIALHCASLPVLDSRDAEDILGYDERGLPS